MTRGRFAAGGLLSLFAFAASAASAAFAGCAKEPAASQGATSTQPATHLALRLRDAEVAAPSAADLQKLGGARITVDDPHEHGAIDLEGIAVTALFDATFGSAWRSAEEVVATCEDGFHPAIPVALFLQHDAYVAYARPGSQDFAVQEEPTKRTPVGPYYLVWKKGAGADPPEPAWPYAVTALEVTDFATRFARVAPPPDAGPLVGEGFEAFRTFCLPCHTLNGSGGAVGPELNYPVSVTEYFSEPLLRQWIADPSRVRWHTKMPPPLPSDGNQPRTVDAVVAYLKAMAQAKQAPPGP